MDNYSTQGIFNARWMSPKDVALSFVPIPQFHRLTHSGHSVLLGPRGCGKTTLLKMLTRTAILTWDAKRKSQFDPNPIEYPQFEAIYIPSDVRWSYELRELSNEPGLDVRNAELIQRAMVTISFLTSAIEFVKDGLRLETAEESQLCQALIDIFNLQSTIPRFFDIKKAISNIAATIRGSLNFRDSTQINSIITDLPKVFFGHITDVPVNMCNLLSDLFNDKLSFDKWALCYDELELAPDWMRKELFESLRSMDQRFYLKLTCSPLLPSGLKSSPEETDDFSPIRLWYSHVKDASNFCENLTNAFLKSKFPDKPVDPDKFFSNTYLADIETKDDSHSYEPGSVFYKMMLDLVKQDASFRATLESSGIDPNNPYSESVEIRDKFFRKIKPVVILRTSFLKASGLRTIKVPTIYYGKEAIYSMSEANPRWLLRLLTDIYDRWRTNPKYNANGIPVVSLNEQARSLNSAAERFRSFLAATAAGRDKHASYSLLTLLNSIGKYFQNEILGSNFNIDPIGSFVVDGAVPQAMEKIIEKALEIGAIVYIGKSDDEIPKQIRNSRFRLSFMLAPLYRLPFRTYRSIPLYNLIKKRHALFDQISNTEL